MFPTLAAIIIVQGFIAVVARAESCGDFPAPGFDAPDQRRYERAYSNSEYGFSVNIPPGLVGHAEPPPAPLHGFGVVLSWEPRAYIYFDGSYEVLDQSLSEARDRRVRWLRESAETVVRVERSSTRLGELEALAFITHYKCADRAGTFVEHSILAYTKDAKVIYTAALLTTADRYAADRAVFDRFLKTWRTHSRT